MKHKKRLWLLLIPVLLLGLWAGLNLLVDPFGAFGGMEWDAYSMTLNQRHGKVAWLRDHLEDYDAYILGGSAAEAFRPASLDERTGCRFYNLFHEGPDIEYDRQLAAWLLSHDEVKRMYLVLSPEDADCLTPEPGLTRSPYYEVSGDSALGYWVRHLFASPGYALDKLKARRSDTALPQSFDLFDPGSGTYDRRLRDAESVGTLQSYLDHHADAFTDAAEPLEMARIDRCADAVADIRRLCDEAGTELTVVLAPVSQARLGRCGFEALDRFYASLAKSGPVWDCSVSSMSFDARFFYDCTHPRASAADLVLAQIFDDPAVPRPTDLGRLCPAGSSFDTRTQTRQAQSAFAAAEPVQVPILLYHHLSEEGEESGALLRPETFARQLRLLKDEGFNVVSLDALVGYVCGGEALPEKPVVITFDDGYLSNYEYGFPVLQELEMPATIFAIGSSIGHDRYYKDTNYEMTPHFGAAEIEEMTASGLVSIQSHTYDMHQWPPFEASQPARNTILPFGDESQADYMAALTADAALQDEAFAAVGLPAPRMLAFPQGERQPISDVTLKQYGYRVTLTIDASRDNELVPGLPESLIDLGRLTVAGDTTDEMLLAYLTRGQTPREDR